jgi:cytochrome c-type biogenesis protein CcmH/NrfG
VDLKPLEEAVRVDSLNPQKHFELGNAYFDQGRSQDARAQFQRTVDLDSTFWKGWINLGTVLEDINYRESRPAFEHASRLRPKDPVPYVKLGNSYYGTGNRREALDYYRQALKVDPRHLETHFMLGNAYAEQDMYREAVREWKKVQAFGPGSSEARAVEDNLQTVYKFFEDQPKFQQELKALGVADAGRPAAGAAGAKRPPAAASDARRPVRK